MCQFCECYFYYNTNTININLRAPPSLDLSCPAPVHLLYDLYSPGVEFLASDPVEAYIDGNGGPCRYCQGLEIVYGQGQVSVVSPRHIEIGFKIFFIFTLVVVL